MKQHSPRRPFDDIKYSSQLLIRNYIPFLKMQLFAIILTLITFFIIIGIGFVFRVLFRQEISEPIRYIMRVFIIIFGGFITVFLSTTNGLAVDIFDSGDEFTEFRNAFKYFGKYWWQYLIISIIVFGFPNAFQGIISEPRIRGLIQDIQWDKFMFYEAIGLIFSYVWYSLFMCVYPSLTVQGNLKHAFVENFRILKVDAKRVFGTWALFFLLFHLPIYVFGSLSLILHVPPFGIFWIFFTLVNLFLGTPLQYLVATGMYFNIKFERFESIE
ncbi:MAG: hypothetical protein JW776_09000 [Candidatus Lokiarchaeota archaeon]|nr:hypothetical protein [Candidatus Lokiarchaeota archaeon]